jgi:PAS domain S-box-containing protein
MTRLESPTLETAELLPLVFDAVGRGLLVTDLGGRIVLANQLARDLLELSPGSRLETLQPLLWSKTEPILAGRLDRSQLPLQLQGREHLAMISPLRQEQELVGAVCIVLEAGQLENMAQQLTSLTTLTRERDAIIDSSSDGLFVCDAEANVLRMNPASERIHQVAAAEIVGRNMRQLIEQGFIDRSAALEASRSLKPVTLLQTKHGRRLMSIATPVFDDSGSLVRIVVSERDISEIDRLQRELEQQEALSDEFREKLRALQLAEVESRQVIARSPKMLRALQQAIKVSKADSSVLILGESGVGKGLIADLIHQHSARSQFPLIKINCGAIPESLIEAELFGYEKGAFTGAREKGKPGQLELADKGILFLDEIAELPLTSQVKLLRFLEDGRITRLGATSGHKVDVRIIAATHRNLEEMVEKRLFRHDLYYRLNVIPIQVPAVRDRRECLIPLLRHYIDVFSQKNQCLKKLTGPAIDALAAYTFPGNVRELMNICERLVVMTDTEVIDLPDLPSQVRSREAEAEAGVVEWRDGQTLQEVLDRVEKNLLSSARERCRNQSEVAAALGVNQSTIARKFRKHGLL